jgi:hypothetical protein
MSVQDSRANLAKAMKELLFRWGETQTQWTDAMSENFEKNRLMPLEADLHTASQAMDQMAQVLSKVRRDCSE